MIAHRGQPANRRELIEAQGHNFLTYDERRIEVKISRLRKKIREITELDDPIKAEWGLGYAFSAPCSLQ
jgi:DNA-binding response OmpR family regulator